MDGCLVDYIATHGARAVQVFHGNDDYEHWQTGKYFHTHTHSLTTRPSLSPLHPLLHPDTF